MKATAKSPNKKRTFAFILILMGAAVLLFKGTLAEYADGMSVKDGIYIPDSSYRFLKSEAKDGMYSHTFRIYNLRPRRLEVEAQPDCGCTGVSWEKTSILPFGWEDVTAQMKSTGNDNGNSVAIGFHSSSSHQPWTFAFLRS